MTVYRALGALVEKGPARKVLSQNAFVATDGPGTPAAYVTCRRCGETRAARVDAELSRRACPSLPARASDLAIEVTTGCGAWCGRKGTA